MKAQYPIVGSIKINTMSDEDYNAFRVITPDEHDFKERFMRSSGYNPGSALGNRQVCNICGQSGSECKGHPLVLPLTDVPISLSAFGFKIVSMIAGVTCTKCKTIVRSKNGKAETIDAIHRLKPTDRKCECASGTKPLNPSINPLKEICDTTCKKRNVADDVTVAISEVYKLIMALIEKGELVRVGLIDEYIMGLFFDRMILQPSSIHPMAFLRGASTSVGDVTGMMNVYTKLAKAIHDRDPAEIQNIQRQLYVTGKGDVKSRSQYDGIQSHIVANDGKRGLLRGIAEGKRMRNTGRSVLTPNTYGRSGELACPLFISSNLQYRIVVSRHNIKYLQARAGTAVSHFVGRMELSPTNDRPIYKKITPGAELREGDIVLKSLENGDHVLFGRHPILHRHSLISYRIRKWDDYCIGLHETNTQGHNADFDGDEGNITIGADMPSRVELAMIDAAYNLFGGRSGEPIVGISYNGVVGAFTISTHDNMPAIAFDELLEEIRSRGDQIDKNHYIDKAKAHGIPYYSGRTLVSMLLPKTLNYERGRKVSIKVAGDICRVDGKVVAYTIAGERMSFTFNGYPYTVKVGASSIFAKDVVIKDGFMLSGSLRAVDVANKLITAISMIDRYKAPYFFVDRGYAMMSKYVDLFTMTISVNDYVKLDRTRLDIMPEGIGQRIDELDVEVKRLERSKQVATPATASRIEDNISQLIDSLVSSVHEVLTDGPYQETHNAIIAYKSGARGTVSNIASATSIVGQMYSGNRRYNPNESRASLYAPPDSRSIFDCSFIRTSFAAGLSPADVMQVANPARAQALATYLGTPESGKAARETELHQDGIRVSQSISLIGRDGRVMDALAGYGCNSTHVTYRETRLGDIESPVDPIAIIDMIKAQRGL